MTKIKSYLEQPFLANQYIELDPSSLAVYTISLSRIRSRYIDRVTVEVQAGKRVDSPEVVMEFVVDFLFSTHLIFILGAHNPISQNGEGHFIEINDVNTLIQMATDIIMRNFVDRSSREKVNLISYILNDLRERVYQFNPPIKRDINQKISLVSDPYYELIVDYGKLTKMVEEWEDGHKK